ncbi:MAG TPA: dTMP kinase, partial [Alphaproteobacteria bacterium]|nr:dTMP kinase [Alphaproteobacteria bacterium]
MTANPTTPRGLFITFEGGEGAGKTTQIRLLAERLDALKRAVLTTREPGGTPQAEKIRDLLVRRDAGEWGAMAESLMFFAARAVHVDTLIRPALEAGKIVLCDRFTDSTRVYQCDGRGLSHGVIEVLNTLVLGTFRPDLTFI